MRCRPIHAGVLGLLLLVVLVVLLAERRSWSQSGPVVRAVTPPYGLSAGGDTVRIMGDRFEPGAKVFFGDTPAASATVDADGAVTAITPALSRVRGLSVTVTNPDGQSGSLPAAFGFFAGAPREEVHELLDPNTGKTQPITVLLPPEYDESQRAHPVVYGYNAGGGGRGLTGWLAGTRDSLLATGRSDEPILFVRTSRPPTEGFLYDVAVPFVDAHYRTLPLRHHRAVTGWSNSASDAGNLVIGRSGAVGIGVLVDGNFDAGSFALLEPTYRAGRHPLRFWLYGSSIDHSSPWLESIGSDLAHYGGVDTTHRPDPVARAALLEYLASAFNEVPLVQPPAIDLELAGPLYTGRTTHVDATVRPGVLAGQSQAFRVTADLSDFGGPEQTDLVETADGGYRLSADLSGVGGVGVGELLFRFVQGPADAPHAFQMSRDVPVLPVGDHPILGEPGPPSWQVSSIGGLEGMDLNQTERVHHGTTSAAFRVRSGGSFWDLTLEPPEPVSSVGYEGLGFAFHPGDTAGERTIQLSLSSRYGYRLIDLTGEGYFDPEGEGWQVVEIPRQRLRLESERARILSLSLRGFTTGTLYLDEVRLIAPPPERGTAVTESRDAGVAAAFALDPNYPNPFNASTVIGFALDRDADVRLQVYDLLGQRVATLVEGFRPPGRYAVTWDGVDAAGRPLASGVYFVRLRYGDLVESRRMALVR